MKDKLQAIGEVDITIFENGKLIDRITERNLVVTLGKQNIARLLGGHASGKKIQKISVGTSSTTTDVGDTSITNAFTKDITSVEYPDYQSVLFKFDINNDEANGKTIREFGLRNTDNILCARKVRTGEIVKTDAIRIAGTWKITVN